MLSIDSLKTQGFYIERVTEKQWKKWADKIQKVTGLKWRGGTDLDNLEGVDFPNNIGYRPTKNGITYSWLTSEIDSVPFRYKTLKKFRHAIKLFSKYEELRNDGFDIAGVTPDDLKNTVFKKLDLAWESGDYITAFTPSYSPFYLQWIPRSFTGLVVDNVPLCPPYDNPTIHKFSSFQDFVDYLKEDDNLCHL